jgi:hypothetical protein
MNLKAVLFFSFLLINVYCFAQTGSIKGTITDDKTGEKLVGASVNLIGTNQGASTDVSGSFIITNIKPGTYIVKANYIGYDLLSKQVTIASGQTLTLNFKISPNSDALKEVNVVGRLPTETEAAAIANERYSDNLKNVVGAKTIEKSPDINAANVLARVSGVTIQRNGGGDDAYAIIRGLEPRYNNTLINGVQISSPDNKSRLVSLSLVPSDLLSRIEVDKSLTPEMLGDAIGGTVNLVFKDAPEKREISASGAVGYNQLFFDRKFVDFSKKDIKTYSPSETNGASYIAQPNDFTRSNLDFQNITAPPSETFAFTYGERFLNKKFGFIIGYTFQNLYLGSNTEGNSGNADPNDPDRRPRINDIFNRAISSHQVLNNVGAHFDYKINLKNKINLDNVFFYTHIEEALFNADTSITGGNGGRTISGTGPVAITRQSTLTNQYVENLKLSGNHVLDNHFTFDWYGSLSDAFVRIPDQAAINSNILISYAPGSGFTKTAEYFDDIDRTWSHHDDRTYIGDGNLSYKTFLNKSNNSIFEVKAGGIYSQKSRYNNEDEYILRNPLGGGKPPFINIYTVQWSVYNPTGTSENVNNYTATEDITSYYGQLKLTLPQVEFIGGVRVETTSQDIHIVQDPTNAQEVINQYTDVLPSFGAKIKLTDKANLRLNYYAAIARPALFELAPNIPPAGSGGVQTEGNPHLKHTTSNNFDIRYELFPKADEEIFVGAYYKKLINPIETSYVGGSGSVIEPINSASATVAGFELVFTRYIGNFGLSGNYAFNYSNVDDTLKINRLLPAILNTKLQQYVTNYTTEHRMLFGASVHDLNVSFLYRNKKAKINAQLAFQYLGKTLVGRYPDNGDNYIQQPLSVLAFSADKGIGRHFTVFTKLNNLTNAHTTVVLHNFQNGNEVTKATYLAGIRYNY